MNVSRKVAVIDADNLKDKDCLMSNDRSPIADDLLVGVSAISAYLGKPYRSIAHALENKHIPGFKLGGRWHMRKSSYIRHIERLEASAAA